MRNLLFTIAFAAAALAAGPAHATFVDFRTSPFHGGHLQTSFGITVHGTLYDFEARPTGASLHHDSEDGFGVSSLLGPERDEIEGKEILSLSFWKNALPAELEIESILLTDLFNEATRESGRIELWSSIDGLTVIDVEAALDQIKGTNGELLVPVGVHAHEILFTAPGRVDGNWEEFSVAGLATPMPEPTAGIVFCVGSLVVAAALRRRWEEADLG
jgi:hypothetical protein